MCGALTINPSSKIFRPIMSWVKHLLGLGLLGWCMTFPFPGFEVLRFRPVVLKASNQQLGFSAGCLPTDSMHPKRACTCKCQNLVLYTIISVCLSRTWAHKKTQNRTQQFQSFIFSWSIHRIHAAMKQAMWQFNATVHNSTLALLVWLYVWSDLMMNIVASTWSQYQPHSLFYLCSVWECELRLFLYVDVHATHAFIFLFFHEGCSQQINAQWRTLCHRFNLETFYCVSNSMPFIVAHYKMYLMVSEQRASLKREQGSEQ